MREGVRLYSISAMNLSAQTRFFSFPFLHELKYNSPFTSPKHIYYIDSKKHAMPFLSPLLLLLVLLTDRSHIFHGCHFLLKWINIFFYSSGVYSTFPWVTKIWELIYFLKLVFMFCRSVYYSIFCTTFIPVNKYY